MAVQRIEIFFIRTSTNSREDGFLPGKTLTGTIAVTSKAPVQIRSLEVQFKGAAKVKWDEDDDNSSTTYCEKEKYFEAKVLLLGESTIGLGTQEIPFSYELPQQIPNSFKGRHGFIEYTITAILKEKKSFLWSGVHKKVGVFPVHRPLDLNAHALAKRPILRQETHDFFNLRGNLGNIELIASIPQCGLFKGETYAVNVKAINSSSVRIKNFFLILAEKLVFRAEGRTKISYSELSRVKFDGMEANSTSNRLLSMVLPRPGHGDISTCSIIKQTYFMQIELVSEGFHRNPTVRLDPLFYSTVPLSNIIHECKPILEMESITTRNSFHKYENASNQATSSPSSESSQNYLRNLSHLTPNQSYPRAPAYFYDPPPPYSPITFEPEYYVKEM